MGEAKRRKMFNPKDYSLKIQRKYARIKAASTDLHKIQGINSEYLAEKYRESLKAKAPLGTGDARIMWRRLFTQKPKQGTPSAYQQKIDALCTSGYAISPRDSYPDYVGVEIECSVDLNKLPTTYKDRLKTQGTHEVLREFFKDNRLMRYETKNDGSIRTPEQHDEDSQLMNLELILLSRAGQMSNVRRAGELLRKLDARVNARCGLHVHLDMRLANEDEVDRVANKFVKALPLLLAMQHPLRRNNKFCLPQRNEIGSDTRYVAVNASAYLKHKTIEIRLHSGTTNADKIMHWVTLLHEIKITNFEGEINTPDEAFLKLPGLPKATLDYIRGRVDLFSGEISEIAKKNKAGVAFADNDAEETRLADVVNHELLGDVVKSLQSITRYEDLRAFLLVWFAEREQIQRLLAQERNLVYGEIIDDMIEVKEKLIDFKKLRDAHIAQDFINKMHGAATTEHLRAIGKEFDHQASNYTSDHPDFVSKTVRPVLQAVFTQRERELSHTVFTQHKFDFSNVVAPNFSKHYESAPRVEDVYQRELSSELRPQMITLIARSQFVRQPAFIRNWLRALGETSVRHSEHILVTEDQFRDLNQQCDDNLVLRADFFETIVEATARNERRLSRNEITGSQYGLRRRHLEGIFRGGDMATVPVTPPRMDRINYFDDGGQVVNAESEVI